MYFCRAKNSKMTADKNDIHYSNEQEHKNVCLAMKGFMDNGKPKVGIFWYDIMSDTLFGVEKKDAEMAVFINGKATIDKLHKTYWQKQHHRARSKNDETSIFYGEHNYTMIPRGRIFLDEETGKFQVYVGHWLIEGVQGQLVDQQQFRETLEDEFNLPEDFDFVVDVHWDIGHGWSEEMW